MDRTTTTLGQKEYLAANVKREAIKKLARKIILETTFSKMVKWITRFFLVILGFIVFFSMLHIGHISDEAHTLISHFKF